VVLVSKTDAEVLPKSLVTCYSHHGTVALGASLYQQPPRKAMQYQGYSGQESFRRRHTPAFIFPGVI